MSKTDTTKSRMSAAFTAGTNAAYDDLGTTEPPWYLAGYSDEEREAWKRGLEQGYKDCEAMNAEA